MADLRLPGNTHRHAIIGRTGSGKTQAGSWFLSHAPFDKQPYVVFDYKGDDLLNSIPYIKELRLGDVPKKPGLYITHPIPEKDDAVVEKYLWDIWSKEKIGLYFDETYMIPDGPAFKTILTQGRSKRIPVIACTQRPRFITRFLFSEADFYSVFHLNDLPDIKRVEEMLPGSLTDRLPPYHSRYYDVGNDLTFVMKPVPERDTILDRFDERLAPKRVYI